MSLILGRSARRRHDGEDPDPLRRGAEAEGRQVPASPAQENQERLRPAQRGRGQQIRGILLNLSKPLKMSQIVLNLQDVIF